MPYALWFAGAESDVNTSGAPGWGGDFSQNRAFGCGLLVTTSVDSRTPLGSRIGHLVGLETGRNRV